jgi:hypothetical protein
VKINKSSLLYCIVWFDCWNGRAASSTLYDSIHAYDVSHCFYIVLVLLFAFSLDHLLISTVGRATRAYCSSRFERQRGCCGRRQMAAAACCAPSFHKHTDERIKHIIVAFAPVLIRENPHRIVRCLQQCTSTSRFSQCQQVAGWLFSTTFFISHKLASTMYTDRSVQVEDGRNFIRVALLASKLWRLWTI